MPSRKRTPCKRGQVRSRVTGRCRKRSRSRSGSSRRSPCRKGMTRNPDTGRCRVACKPGQIRSPNTGRCINRSRKRSTSRSPRRRTPCKSYQYRSRATGHCRNRKGSRSRSRSRSRSPIRKRSQQKKNAEIKARANRLKQIRLGLPLEFENIKYKVCPPGKIWDRKLDKCVAIDAQRRARIAAEVAISEAERIKELAKKVKQEVIKSEKRLHSV